MLSQVLIKFVKGSPKLRHWKRNPFLLEKGVFEVEFSNKNGQPIAFLAANEKDLLLLHFESIAA